MRDAYVRLYPDGELNSAPELVAGFENRRRMERIFMLLLLFPMGAQDLLCGRLSLCWMLAAGLAGGLYHIIFTEWGIFDVLAGGLTGSVLLLLSLKNSGIGSGDGILFLAIGEIIGYIKCFVLLEQSLLLCFAVGMILRICLHKSKEYRIPMTPIVLSMYLVAAITEGGA